VLKRFSNDTCNHADADRALGRLRVIRCLQQSAGVLMRWRVPQVGQKEWKLAASGPQFAVWEAVL
jgi:hypothetical protein